MAIFAIGDLQGCYSDLRRLLEKIHFDPASDALWFTGDLVNRGPESLACLRFVYSLGDAAVSVLGNHDLHLIAKSEGLAPSHRSDPDLDDIIDAPDAADLLHWLRHRPMAHCEHDMLMIHAGLPPQWNLAMTLSLAKEAEQALQQDGYRDLLSVMYSDQPDLWHDELAGHDRVRFIINALTRLRLCDAQGRLLLRNKGGPENAPPDAMPWFRVAGRASENQRIVFGHWSTLGLHQENNVYCLDSGCVWGDQLSAIRIDQAGEAVCVQCQTHQAPTSGSS